jgi:hypothetical protein
MKMETLICRLAKFQTGTNVWIFSAAFRHSVKICSVGNRCCEWISANIITKYNCWTSESAAESRQEKCSHNWLQNYLGLSKNLCADWTHQVLPVLSASSRCTTYGSLVKLSSGLPHQCRAHIITTASARCVSIAPRSAHIETAGNHAIFCEWGIPALWGKKNGSIAPWARALCMDVSTCL